MSTQQRAKVGLIYTKSSRFSCEGEYLARYTGILIAVGGYCEKVRVVGLSRKVNKSSSSSSSSSSIQTSAWRYDDKIIEKTSRYEETEDINALKDLDVWILCMDAEETTIENMNKLIGRANESNANDTDKKKTKPKKRIIASLQSAVRQLTQLEQCFPNEYVLFGGAGFQVILDPKGHLKPLSTGCFYMERLAPQKVDPGLFVINILESTGIQVLNRKNIPIVKWGTSIYHGLYYLSALTNQTVHKTIQDRNCRLLLNEMLYECTHLLQEISQKNQQQTQWIPDLMACTILPYQVILILLPLPNFLFNGFFLRVFDFGWTSSSESICLKQIDLFNGRQTDFEQEFGDLLTIAKRHELPCPVMQLVSELLVKSTLEKKPIVLDSRVIASKIQFTKESRVFAKTILLKIVVTIVLTSLLLHYLFFV